MDFELTDEQRLIQDTVRDFVDRKVLPNAVENDIAHRLDMSVIEGMAELGLLGIVIPEEYGGAGLDFVAEALSCEEIERGEAAFRTLISVHVGLNSLSLLRYASEEQKQRYLVPQARGEKLACFGLTEPAAGSDVASMRTTARREGDAYVLNGQKNWISYASVADHQLVFAKTDPGAKHKGISAFIVERGWKGVSTRDTENKLGIWAGSTGELFFENVEVPVENLVGDEGQGFEIAMYGLDQGRFTVAAGACGVVRACLERSVEYARERETFGQQIGRYQFVQDMIAEMVLGYETSKLLVMQAAWMKNEGLRNTRETSLAKWHATESAFKAAHLAIQVHGAYGYSAEYGIERYFRNARAPIIYEGTTQIHKLMQAEHALGFRRLNGRDGDVSPLASWAPALSGVHRPAGPVPTGA
ncbi:MAG TPA: acyl-CoA dehydrogenase family protein [Gaiellaceae bacterium]|nr:acyl-CoA dehydrogenase family protein [Gaiellaceae bacterium]